MNREWDLLDEVIAVEVMGLDLILLSEHRWKQYWPAWPRETRMRLAWIVDDDSLEGGRIEAPPGTEKNGLWQPAFIHRYSKDLGHAMLVFNRMRNLGHRWLMNADIEGFHLRRVACVMRDLSRDEKQYLSDLPLGTAKTLDELPKVICLAALKEIKEAKS